jgi:putative protease
MRSEYSIELLAPARDVDCGITAVNSGADAVYIGAPRFGAREKAGNSLDDIAQLVDYAHSFWAKVYVTLNTLLYDHEVQHAVHLAHQLYDLGTDALIIQDYALLECDMPPTALIASTQMHNNTPERVKFLENVGFERAILARELSLEEIRAIKDQTKIELEVFVHGALCVSYSGRCYMSYAVGGRSGNRGQCAQPCRRLYSLVDADNNILVKDKHLLSLKDMNRLHNLEDLVDAGVTSFKIEGRLKDAVYVRNIVSAYRQQLDILLLQQNLKASSSGEVIHNFESYVNKTFNRGYTTYFLHGRNGKPGAIETPKMTGERLGTVTDLRNHTVTINSEFKLIPGDGLCWFDSNKKLQGTYVNKVSGRKIILHQIKGLKKGMELFRNHDHAFISMVRTSKPVRKIQIKLRLEETSNGYKLTAEDADGNQVSHCLILNKEKAVKTESAVATIRKQLARMGGTPYSCSAIEIGCTEIPFIPVAKLNELRRDTLRALSVERDNNRPTLLKKPEEEKTPTYPQTHLDYQYNVLNKYASTFLRRHGVLTIEPAAESGLLLKGRTIMRTRQCLKRQLGWCNDQNQQKHSDKQLFLIDEDGHKYPLHFDCQMCEMEVFF